jgi:beta-phosphoglucomutase-like phosphatase (HAD superfamily)
MASIGYTAKAFTSGSENINSISILRHYAPISIGIVSYFDTIVSGLDVARVKPAPDIFLEAAHRLGVDPAECAVLEDAEKGLAAHAAGMRCVAVPNEYTRDHDFSKATHVCSSLNEVTVKLLQDIGINT